MNVGLEKINKFKKEQGLTNEELAKLSGVPKSTIDKITAGATYDPKLDTVKAIAKALGKTLNDFDDVSPEAPARSRYSFVTEDLEYIENAEAGKVAVEITEPDGAKTLIFVEQERFERVRSAIDILLDGGEGSALN